MESVIKYTVEALKKNQMEAEYFENANLAVESICAEIDCEKSVGMGGSVTLFDTKLPDRLMSRGNKVYFPWYAKNPEERKEIINKACNADVFITSTNALTENGMLVNIDGVGNRVSSMIFGHEKVYILCGKNKIVKNIDAAFERIKEIAPKLAKGLKFDTPCAVTGKCEDCNSSQRMCRIITIIEKKPLNSNIKVLLVNEELGL